MWLKLAFVEEMSADKYQHAGVDSGVFSCCVWRKRRKKLQAARLKLAFSLRQANSQTPQGVTRCTPITRSYTDIIHKTLFSTYI